VWRTFGVPGCVTKCDRMQRESKLAKNTVTYFMDGPFVIIIVGLIIVIGIVEISNNYNKI